MHRRLLRRYLFTWIAAFIFLAGVAQARNGGREYAFQVDGLACPFCAYGIEKRLNAVDGVAELKIDIASGTVTVIMVEGKTLDEATATKAVAAAGFTLRSFTARNSGP